MTFFLIVSRIMTAALLGQAALRGYFEDPNGFALTGSQHNGVKRPIERAYKLLW